MSIMSHASSAASLRYLKTAEGRSREIADAIGRRMESGLTAAMRDVPLRVAARTPPRIGDARVPGAAPEAA